MMKLIRDIPTPVQMRVCTEEGAERAARQQEQDLQSNIERVINRMLEAASRGKYYVLVVFNSRTSTTLIKEHFVRSGYEVKCLVDTEEVEVVFGWNGA